MIIGHWQLALPADDCPMAGVRQVWHRGDMVIRPGDAADRDWIACKLAQRWGSTTIVTRGRPCDAASLPALIAVDTTCEHGPERVGLLTYRLDREGLEVVTIDALKTGAGIGTALLSSVVRTARNAKAGRVWLITTNDNLPAISFYGRKGFRVIAVHKGAVDLARSLKPSIPLVAENGIELHDELELELNLKADAGAWVSSADESVALLGDDDA